MNLSAALGLSVAMSSLIAGSLTLNAQQGRTPQPDSLTTIVIAAPAPSCPVSMRAQHGNGNQLVKTRDDSYAPDMEQPLRNPLRNQVQQTIRLILTDPAHDQITSATVTARGLTARPRISQTLSTNGEKSDVSRTLVLSFSEEDNKSVSANLHLPGFAVVNSLRLVSVTYADGSTRKFDGAPGCSVAPDPLMLGSAR